MSKIACSILIGLLAALPLAGCVVYEPVGYTTTRPASFDRSWNAALDAAQDVGIGVTQADRASGRIYGRHGGVDVFIAVLRQPDGSLRVQFDAKNLGAQDLYLDQRFTQAYDRRMGR